MPPTTPADYALTGSPPLLPSANRLHYSSFDGWEPFGMWLAIVYNRARSTLGYVTRTTHSEEVKEACRRRQTAIVEWRRSFPDPSTLQDLHQAGELLPLAKCMGNLQGVAETIWTMPLKHALVLPSWQAMMCRNQPVPTHHSSLAGTLVNVSDPFIPGARSRSTSNSISELWWQHQARLLGSSNAASFDDLPKSVKDFKEPFQLRQPAPAASFDAYPLHQHSFPLDHHTPALSGRPALSPMVEYAAHHGAYSAPTSRFAAPMHPTLGSNAMFDEHGKLVPHHGSAPGWTQR
ncbi:hypothetical protein JCM10295v2_002030 [Rhodotorula toruloides]